MGIKHANPIPAFLPRDMSFRYKQLEPTADLPDIIASIKQQRGHIDNLYEIINEISAETERRVGLMKNSFTRTNYLANGWFRQATAGVPNKWTSAGAGATFSVQTNRTAGLFDGQAARIVGLGTAGTLTQVVTNIGVGTKWSLTGWVKLGAYTSSGSIVITPNGTNPVITRFAFSGANYGTGWFCFPSVKAAVGHIELPNDATQITIVLTADTQSTVDFAELQLGPGTVGYPTMYVPSAKDIYDGGGGTTPVWNETPTGTINGVNDTFTLAYTPSPAASVLWFKNGLLQRASGNDYTLTGNSAVFVAGNIPQTDDIMLVSYQY